MQLKNPLNFIKKANPLNFIKKVNRSFNIYLGNYKQINSFLDVQKENQGKLDVLLKNQDTLLGYQDKINSFLDVQKENWNELNQLRDSYREDREKLDVLLKNQEDITALILTHVGNQKKMDTFLASYSTLEDDLRKAVDNFNKTYSEFKHYFFNGEEGLFKYMDTDNFFMMCVSNGMRLLSYSPSENQILLETKEGIKLITNNRYYTIKEIFGCGGYESSHLHQFKEFIVFDIGMNRGYASLKFASFNSCKAVYGFEIDKDTYNFALDNFNLNPSLNSKITTFNFGLSNEDAEVDIYTLPGSDGITTTELEFTETQVEWVKAKENMVIKKARVKEAGPMIADIIKKDKINSNIVLKIDTEGSEYKIFNSLISSGVLNQIDLIMGENHLTSKNLDDLLIGFTNINNTYHPDSIFGFIYVKDELYKPLTPNLN